MYGAKIRVFKSWCEVQDIKQEDINIAKIADFLMWLFQDKNLQLLTIMGYRTALQDFFPTLGIKAHTSLSRLIQSFFRDRPRSCRSLPPWDLRIVLQALIQALFEPMAVVDLKFITYKTVFLIALAPGARRSELHALITT